MSGNRVMVQLLFADSGSFHDTTLLLDSSLLEPYPRLIDAFREDEGLQKELYVDMGRLVGAWILPEPAPDGT